MAGGDEVAMPAQDRVWTYQQPDLVQGLAGKPVEESRGQGSVGGGEANPVTVGVEPVLENGDLVAQGQDLYVLVPVAGRQQPQHGQPVRYGQVRQSKHHRRASSPIRAHRRGHSVRQAP
jgi:hypothetical protein